MHVDVLNDYLDREIEVSTTSNKTFRGTLKLHHSSKMVVILTPRADRYQRYGDTVINVADIVTLREILPQIDEDDEDMKEEGDSDVGYKTAHKRLMTDKVMAAIDPLASHDHGVG